MTRLLLVSPGFHGYWQSIEDAFASLGYAVTTHVYDASPMWEKAYNKVRFEVGSRLIGGREHLSPEVVTRRAADAVRHVKPDLVLVVRGDVLLDEFWDAVDQVGARVGTWLYDELRRMRVHGAVQHRRGRVASYSSADVEALRAEGHEALHVPLAFDPRRGHRRSLDSGEFTFIGARFERRERFLASLQSAGFPIRAYGRDWSAHPYDQLRTFRFRPSRIPAGRDLPLDQALDVMAASVATLNIHGDQDGFTMRTFEASGIGAVQLIDRNDVAAFYEPGAEVLTFSDEAELLDAAARAERDRAGMRRLRQAARARTLAEHTYVHRARALEALWD